MKIILIALLTSLPIWAQSTKKIVEQLDEINKPSSKVICAEDSNELYDPSEALKDINAGKLTFLGRALFPGNDKNLTCVYKSDTAYILYNNCLSSKKECAATDIEVISFNGDIASFYVQNANATIPVSKTLRSDYSMTWRVSVTATPSVSNKLTVEDLKKFKEKHDAVSGGCSIGSTFKAADLSSEAFCLGGVKNPTWNSAAEKFWKEPGEEWYKTQQYLRKVVLETKF